MLEKPEMTIKNGQSRDTGNIGHTRNRTKTKKKQKNTTLKLKQKRQKTKKYEQHGPHQKPRCSRRV